MNRSRAVLPIIAIAATVASVLTYSSLSAWQWRLWRNCARIMTQGTSSWMDLSAYTQDRLVALGFNGPPPQHVLQEDIEGYFRQLAGPLYIAHINGAAWAEAGRWSLLALGVTFAAWLGEALGVSVRTARGMTGLRAGTLGREPWSSAVTRNRYHYARNALFTAPLWAALAWYITFDREAHAGRFAGCQPDAGLAERALVIGMVGLTASIFAWFGIARHLRRAVERSQWMHDFACPKCRYPLEDIPGKICPECGPRAPAASACRFRAWALVAPALCIIIIAVPTGSRRLDRRRASLFHWLTLRCDLFPSAQEAYIAWNTRYEFGTPAGHGWIIVVRRGVELDKMLLRLSYSWQENESSGPTPGLVDFRYPLDVDQAPWVSVGTAVFDLRMSQTSQGWIRLLTRGDFVKWERRDEDTTNTPHTVE